MELLASNGFAITGKACKCAGGGDIWSKGEYSVIVVRGKTFKLKKNGKLVTHRRLNELEYWITNKVI